MYSELCEWPLVWCGDVSDLSPAVTGHAVEFATGILWQATGRQFGNCTVPLRPCRTDCSRDWPSDVRWFNGVASSSIWDYPWPALVGGMWVNLACGLCSDGCSCGTTSKVILGEKVNAIESVVIDGTQLPVTGAYALYNGNELFRTDGGEWPTCQDWNATSGLGTWFVNASFGSDPPPGAGMAVGSLAADIARACAGADCNLIQSVQRVVRQGVTFEKVPAKDLLDSRLTGNDLADLFIRTNNPAGIPDRARAWSPDRMFDARIQG